MAVWKEEGFISKDDSFHGIRPTPLAGRLIRIHEATGLDSMGGCSRSWQATMVCRLTKDFFFEAAHFLPNVPENHKCSRMHGHSYRVAISVEGEVDPALGWLYDHSVISQAMAPIISQLDHFPLNDVPGLENPTIENLCGWLWERLQPLCPGLCEIVVYETPTVRCTYRGQ